MKKDNKRTLNVTWLFACPPHTVEGPTSVHLTTNPGLAGGPRWAAYIHFLYQMAIFRVSVVAGSQ